MTEVCQLCHGASVFFLTLFREMQLLKRLVYWHWWVINAAFVELLGQMGMVRLVELAHNVVLSATWVVCTAIPNGRDTLLYFCREIVGVVCTAISNA